MDAPVSILFKFFKRFSICLFFDEFFSFNVLFKRAAALKSQNQIPYLLGRVPPSNKCLPFDVKYLMSASLELAPLFSLTRNAHLKNSI